MNFQKNLLKITIADVSNFVQECKENALCTPKYVVMNVDTLIFIMNQEKLFSYDPKVVAYINDIPVAICDTKEYGEIEVV